MTKSVQAALVTSLLAIATLCGFGCWGVHAVVVSERQIAVDADATVKAALTTAQNAATAEEKISNVADSLNGLVVEIRPKVSGALQSLQSSAANLDKATAGLNASIAEVNRKCTDGDCGTLADVNRTLNTVRLAAGQVTAVSLKERDQLEQVNQQESDVAAQAKADLVKLGTAIDQVGELAGNGDLKKSLGNLNTTTGAVAGMATDTEQYWHNMLHPKWPARVMNGVVKVVGPVVKFLVF